MMASTGHSWEGNPVRLLPEPSIPTFLSPRVNPGFIAIYAGALPSGDQVAPYVVGLIEAVAYFGIAGGVISVGIFFAFFTVLDGGSSYLGHNAVSPAWLPGATMIIALIAVTLVPVMRFLMAPVDAAELAPELRLSRREHDVLRLVAEG